VVDLVKGHIKSLDYLFRQEKGEALTVNLGTGRGYSVLEMVKAFEQSSGKKVSLKIVERRVGDIASCYADVTKAQEKLGWLAKLTINDMCADVWRFVSCLK
jgi:UDP-glucose 4-epimerase